MDFELSEELIAVRDVAREFAEKEIAPTAAKDDKEHNFRKDLLLKMGELGFFGSVIPENYGGNGLGFLAMVLITEEIARVHSAARVAINMQIGPALALLQFGNEDSAVVTRGVRRLLRYHGAGRRFGCVCDQDDGDAERRWLSNQRNQALDFQRSGSGWRVGLRLHGQESKAPRAIRLLHQL
jgi:hypothetical protein